MKIKFEIFLVIIVSFFLSCSVAKQTKSFKEIDISYIKEIREYSNFKKLINNNFHCDTSESPFVFGDLNKPGINSLSKCYYKNNKNLVYVENRKVTDTTNIETYFYKKNKLVYIESVIIKNNKITTKKKIFVRDNKVYFSPNQSKDHSYFIEKGLNYLNNFEY